MIPIQKLTGIVRLLAVLAAGFLGPFILSTHAETGSGARIEKMTYAELNSLITEGDCNCVMIFMAAWCGPCKEELPDLVRLHRRFVDQGLRFIGISVDSGGPAAIEEVIRQKKVTFPVYWVGETAVEKLNIFGIPMIFMIKKGQILEKIPGKWSYEYLETKMLDFLKR